MAKKLESVRLIESLNKTLLHNDKRLKRWEIRNISNVENREICSLLHFLLRNCLISGCWVAS